MLRESSQIAGYKVQLSDVTSGLSDETHIPQGDLLVALSEAIVARDKDAIADVRGILFQALGNDAVVDAVAVASALFKKEVAKLDFEVDYVGFEIPPEFVVGYGLDYNEKYRHLKDVMVMEPEDID